MDKIIKHAEDIVNEMEEHIEIAKMVKERQQNDTGERYTLDEVKKKLGK